MEIRYDINLKERTTFGLAARAACWVDYYSVEELRSLFENGPGDAPAAGPGGEILPLPLFPIGGGSNLVPTGDFPGTLLHSCIRFIEPYGAENIEKDRSITVRVGAGVPWDEFVHWCCARNWWGPENLSLIPGDVGAAAVQNIGAYGCEVGDLITMVECYDTFTHEMRAFTQAECAYGYRESFFKGEGKGRYIVTAVSLRLTRDYQPRLAYGHLREALIRRYDAFTVEADCLTPAQVRDEVIAIRRSKLPDPSETGSAGSYFRNPYVSEDRYAAIAAMGLGEVPHFPAGEGRVKIPAAWLIDKCGFKGVRRGNAGVYEKQPLVLVNATGQAAPAEILALEEEITRAVSDRFGVTLIPEAEHLPGIQNEAL